jgi:hypothetical protein
MIDDLIFRSSQAGELCGKTGLGVTGQKRAIYTYLEAKYGRVKEFSSKQTKKGILNENEAIRNYNSIYGTNYVKNEIRLSNDFITGECDVDDEENDTILDIKNSWDIFTFHDSKTDTNKNYEFQGDCYMKLYGRKNFKLVHILTDAPDEIVLKELERESYSHPNLETPEWREVQLITQLIYTRENFERFITIRGLGGDEFTDKLIDSFVHIPIEERVSIKEFKYDHLRMEFIEKRINEARTFLKTIYQ